MLIDFHMAPIPIPIPGKNIHRDATYRMTKTLSLQPGVYYVPSLGENHPLGVNHRSSHHLVGYTAPHDGHFHISTTHDDPWHYPYGIAFHFEDIRPWVLNNFDGSNACIFTKVTSPNTSTILRASTFIHPGGITYDGPITLSKAGEEAKSHRTVWMFKIASLDPHTNPLPEDELVVPDIAHPRRLEEAHHEAEPFSAEALRAYTTTYQGVKVITGNRFLGTLTSFNIQNPPKKP